MKSKLFFVPAILIFLLIPIMVMPAFISQDENYSLGKNDRVTDDLYAAGFSITVAGDVEGDVLAAGASILVSGNVSEDVMIAGCSLSIIGKVVGDVRAAGCKITIGDDVGGDVIISGGLVEVLPDVTINGDVIMNGATVKFSGIAKGDVQVNGDQVIIDGTFEKLAEINGQSIVISEKAKLLNGLVYRAPEEAKIYEGSEILGEITYEPISLPVVESPDENVTKTIVAIAGALLLLKIVVGIIAAIVLLKYFRRFSEEVVLAPLLDFNKTLLRGFIVLVVVPVATILLFISVVGSLVGALGLLIYITLMVFAGVYAGIIFGMYFMSNVLMKEVRINWRTASVGIILLQIIALIPIFGWIVNLIFILLALGALSKCAHNRLAN